MVTVPPEDVIAAARSVAEGHERVELDALQRRWGERRLRVLIAGEAKRGKSSLVNALLGRPILPTGITPLTSVVTRVSAAPDEAHEHVSVTFDDGEQIDVALPDVSGFVTEAGNPGNQRGARDVTVWVDSPLLRTHRVDLVDTPGVGSVYAHNTTEARAALATLDAAVLVLSVDPPISAAERDLLEDIAASAVQTFVVVNKCDRFAPVEVDQSVAFTRAICHEVSAGDLEPQPISVARADADAGFRHFREGFLAYLSQRADQDLARALQRHTAHALSAMRDRRRMERRALELAAEGETQTITMLRERLVAISRQRSDIQDRLAGSLRRLRKGLDESAATAVPRLGRDCQTAFERAWEESLADAPLQDLASLAHATIERDVTAAVERWRGREGDYLEARLGELVERTRSEVESQVLLARQAVAEALDMAGGEEEVVVALPVDTRFHYDFSPALSWAPPLQGLTEALRSPAARRRRARATAYESIGPLTDRQVGRARADLQSRLDSAGRRLAQELARELDATIGGMVRVLDRVEADHTQAERDARLRQLTGQEAALTALLENGRQASPPLAALKGGPPADSPPHDT